MVSAFADWVVAGSRRALRERAPSSPSSLRTLAFSIAGGAEATTPARFCEISADTFADWVTPCYPSTAVPAIAIGSSDGAMMHLCAALGIPWLPRTFLAPVRRHADPDDVKVDVDLGRRIVPPPLRERRGRQVHQMHDAN